MRTTPPPPLPKSRSLTCLAVAWFAAVGAQAQTPTDALSKGASPSAIAWQVEAGYESFWLKDVARTSRPVDASPVSWTGSGPALTGRYDRADARRLHRLEVLFSSAGHFVYDAVIRTVPRSPDDSVARVGARYEYRRYLLRDLGIAGLDIGIGGRGTGDYLWVGRHVDPSIEVRESEAQFGVALVAALRFRRWRWLDLDLSWANGGFLTRIHEQYGTDPLASFRAWGGGWSTEVSAIASVPLIRRTRVVASYLHSGLGRYASHDSYAVGRDRVALGVRYGR
jgi:hypothetical protein